MAFDASLLLQAFPHYSHPLTSSPIFSFTPSRLSLFLPFAVPSMRSGAMSSFGDSPVEMIPGCHPWEILKV